SDRKSVKRHKKVCSSLTQLQNSLGRINDIATHKALFTDIINNPRRGLTEKQNHQRAFAAGLIIGDQRARIPGLIDKARKAYNRFDSAKPFWSRRWDCSRVQSGDEETPSVGQSVNAPQCSCSFGVRLFEERTPSLLGRGPTSSSSERLMSAFGPKWTFHSL